MEYKNHYKIHVHNLFIVTLSSKGSCTSAVNIKYHQCFFNCRLSATRIQISFVDWFFLSSHLTAAIEIGFTQRRIFHTEEFRIFDTLINKSRASEQTFTAQVEISTLNSPFGQSATRGEDFQTGLSGFSTALRRLFPNEANITFSYLIIGDNTPENQEVFQLSITPAVGSPNFTCTQANGCFQQLEIVIVDDDGELWQSIICCISSADWVTNSPVHSKPVILISKIVK